MHFWIKTLGAAVLGVLSWIFLIAPALDALTTSDPANASQPSLLAIVDNDAMVAADVVTKIVDVDPSSTDLERVYFELTFGVAQEGAEQGDRKTVNFETTAIDRAAAETAERRADENSRYGQTVVLLGPLAEGLESCDEPSISIDRNLDYSALTDAEKAAVLNYLTGSVSEANADRVSPSSGDQYATPGDVAYGLRYTTLQPRVFYPLAPGSESIKSDDGETRTYDAFWNSFTCDFDGSAFWSEGDDRRTFTFPDMSIISTSANAETVVRVRRTIQDVSTVNSERLSTEGSTSKLPGGIDQVEDSRVLWNSPSAQTSLPSVAVQYGDMSASQHRELLIFLGGVGLSVAAASVVSLGRSFLLLGLPGLLLHLARWRSRRLVEPDTDGNEAR
ncbi:MAG: hypothetical protein JWR04_359 [Rhodoglobus sp.]|nr:hypothetical protein [Rhodoglobus sp.]